MSERVKLRDKMEGSVLAHRDTREKVKVCSLWKFQCLGDDGQVKWTDFEEIGHSIQSFSSVRPQPGTLYDQDLLRLEMPVKSLQLLSVETSSDKPRQQSKHAFLNEFHFLANRVLERQNGWGEKELD